MNLTRAAQTRKTTALAHDPVPLTAGRHTLTVTVTGRNPSATGFFAGPDRFDLSLADTPPQ